MAAAVQGLARIVEVEPDQGGREMVRIALPPDLAVGEDVESGPFLGPDRDQGRVVLRFGQELRRRSPQFPGPYARREPAGELRAVDQPVGLREAPDERGREQGKLRHDGVLSGESRPPASGTGAVEW